MVLMRSNSGPVHGRRLPRVTRTLGSSLLLSLVAAGCGSAHPFDRGPTSTPEITPTPEIPTPTATLAPGETPSPATPTVAPPSFSDDVKPLLSPCTGCHTSGAAGTAWLYDGGAQAYEQVMTKVNLASPEESLLLIKASGGGAHGGGAFYSSSSASYQTILSWIEAGAPNN